MINSLIKKRMFVAISSIILVLVSIYGYRITEKRQKTLDNGKLEKVRITRATTGQFGHGRTLFFSLNKVEYDAGVAIREYDRCKTGDSIEVYYIDNLKYAAQKNRKIYSFTGYFVTEKLAFCLGIILLISSPFLKEKIPGRKIEDKTLNWIDTKTKSSKNLDAYFNMLYVNPYNATIIGKESFLELHKKIQNLYNNYPAEMLVYVQFLLKHQDYKLDYIYNSILECVSYQYFESELKNIYNSLIITQ